jgi:hypothetical protein
MITLDTRKLSEMMEASGPALVKAINDVRDDVGKSRVDAQHQKALHAVRETDDMFINTYLIERQESHQAAIEYLLEELLQVPADEDDSAVYTYIHKARAIKELLQYGD